MQTMIRINCIIDKMPFSYATGWTPTCGGAATVGEVK